MPFAFGTAFYSKTSMENPMYFVVLFAGLAISGVLLYNGGISILRCDPRFDESDAIPRNPR
jgi:hypothetical protein